MDFLQVWPKTKPEIRHMTAETELPEDVCQDYLRQDKERGERKATH